jgi:hypothetical protein
MINSPFLLENHSQYSYWRDKKLKNYPTNLENLVVDITNEKSINSIELKQLLENVKKTNLTLYHLKKTPKNTQAVLPAIGHALGLNQLNKNYLADETGLTTLSVAKGGSLKGIYIPYTNKAINWHTDGYYNAPHQQVRAFALHAEQRAETGGENALLDPEIAYILLREQNPDFIHALMSLEAMSIPPGIDMNGKPRPMSVCPVFSINIQGQLHMRYTARKRNVIWSKNTTLQLALSALQTILHTDGKGIFKGLLAPNMGLVSNNVLHARESFKNSQTYQRLYYRARYFQRIATT